MGLCGQAFTEYVCKECGKTKMWANTGTPEVCPECMYPITNILRNRVISAYKVHQSLPISKEQRDVLNNVVRFFEVLIPGMEGREARRYQQKEPDVRDYISDKPPEVSLIHND